MKLKKADSEFSRYIRLRDSDETGFTMCCTCGKILHWKQMDCGHFRGRSNRATRWIENNAHAQCKTCNQENDGEHFKYADFLIRKYGREIVSELTMSSNMDFKFTQLEVDDIAKYYKQKADELLKHKR